MARAIQALKSCIRPCQNGSSHSGTQFMQLAVPEWLELFLHSSHATGRVRMHGSSHSGLKFGQWDYLRARMARAILALPTIFECHHGLSHSGTQVMQLAVPEWLEPFWHSSHVVCLAVPEWLEPFWPQVRPVGLLVCKNGSSHSGTANNI